MKKVIAIVASVFAVSAFAQAPVAPVKKEEAKPAVASPAAKKETAKPAKSDAPASKEAPKATTK